MHNKLVFAALIAFASTTAFGQASQPTKMQGNINLKASQENTVAVAVGEGNTAKNTAGAIKGGTTIQGNTNIKASQKNAAAIAVGKNNKSANEAGVIGGQ